MKQTIKKEIAKLSVCYPQAKRTVEEIEILTDIWFEDFGNISDDVFIEAVKLHRQRSEFFPTGADILKCCKEIFNRPHDFKEIPETTGERMSMAEFKKLNPECGKVLDRHKIDFGK